MNFRDFDDIAAEAYVYLYPAVIMEITRQQMRPRQESRLREGPDHLVNSFRTVNAKWRTVARSNIDTLFSSAWVDLDRGPAMLTLPPNDGRYHMFQMLDFWSDVYAVPGSRTNGTDGIRLKIVGPGAEQERLVDDGQDLAIVCPTRSTWIIGRTAAVSAKDLAGAREFVTSCSVTQFDVHAPEAQYGGTAVYPSDVPPVRIIEAMDAREYFALGAALLERERPHATDGSILMRLRAIGIREDSEFNFDEQAPHVRGAMADAMKSGPRRMRRRPEADGQVPKWSYMTHGIGTWGNAYVDRAFVARFGLAANPAEDAIYMPTAVDMDGRRLDGNLTYLMRFSPGQTPPAAAFWSITAYDREGFLFPNDLDRFGIRSRDELSFGADGSLTVWMSPSLPPGAPASNWIPTGPSPFDLIIRAYMPGQAILDRTWEPPAVVRVD